MRMREGWASLDDLSVPFLLSYSWQLGQICNYVKLNSRAPCGEPGEKHWIGTFVTAPPAGPYLLGTDPDYVEGDEVKHPVKILASIFRFFRLSGACFPRK